ncbi:TetR/AcrR family transcriptional regulator [Mycolicibacterium sp.]|uniref:TetR/AcrR family transcriptional regulator n=1 Tax=Mycolicibacterium sp. TaxID=2320850 RepID=UPI003D12AA04
MTRAESAAATRRALLQHAGELLDAGGPDAVTLRGVGARAGVSRGAPYRHFADKESLLTAVAAASWERLGERMCTLRDTAELPPVDTLRAALTAVIDLSRRQPHLYQLMFTTPADDPSAVVRAAEAMCAEFLAIVATVVGERDAAQYAGILLTGVHGAAGLEASGLLHTDKWQTSAEELTEALLEVISRSR